MKVTFIGTGGAFTVGDNFQSNILLETDEKLRLLIDCGSDARHALNKLGFSYTDINSVYISHLHADHIGGLEWLGFARYFDSNCERPELYISEDLVDDLWRTLMSGMHSLKEFETELSTFFKVKTIPLKANTFQWAAIDFQLVSTQHIFNSGQSVPCYGLLFKVNGKTLYITADTAYTPDRLDPFYQQADMIFHDCETTQRRSGVHSNFADLCQLPLAIKQKMWLYHYQPGVLPDISQQGFCGFIQPRQTFEIT